MGFGLTIAFSIIKVVFLDA